MNKLFRYFPTKSVFDSTTKAADSKNDTYYEGDTLIRGTPEIKWQDICFIENWEVTSYTSMRKMYTHGQYYNCSDIDNAISLENSYTSKVHGLADSLDVAITIKEIGKNATPENVYNFLDEPEQEIESENNEEI